MVSRRREQIFDINFGKFVDMDAFPRPPGTCRFQGKGSKKFLLNAVPPAILRPCGIVTSLFDIKANLKAGYLHRHSLNNDRFGSN